MGHHIDDQGRFQSDKYPELPPDKVVISLTDKRAWYSLLLLADAYRDDDPEFAEDLKARVQQLSREEYEKEHETVQEEADRETGCEP